MTTDLIDQAQDAPQRSAVQAAMPQRPLTVIEAAIRSGASPDQLQSLLELQVRADNHQLEMMREKRRMDEEDRKAAALLAFRRDFAAFRGENIVVAKSKHVDRGRAGSFMQAEYHAIAQLLSPALSRHGFGFRHDQKFGPKPWPLADNPGNVVGWVWVTCFLEHKDGHVETLELEGPEGDQSANTPVQNMQLTASYLKRQSLLAITGTATGGEDDEAAMRGRRRTEQQGDAGAQQGPDEALLDAGRAAALNGMAALNKWWASLNPRQQKDMGTDFGPMRKAARQVDEGGQR
jgi:hypothetical protein